MIVNIVLKLFLLTTVGIRRDGMYVFRYVSILELYITCVCVCMGVQNMSFSYPFILGFSQYVKRDTA